MVLRRGQRDGSRASTRWFTRRLALFHFTQIEVPFPLGPPDGRYLVRPGGAGPKSDPSHVLVLATLGTSQRRLLERAGRRRPAPPQPPPMPVRTGRATIITTTDPFADDRPAEARERMRRAGRLELDEDLNVLRRALCAYRAVSADPEVRPVGIGHLLVARIGFGAGEDVADGHWTEATELPIEAWQRETQGRRRGRRQRAIEPQARLADALRGRVPVLLCEELTLRARADLDHGQHREAAVQLAVALDAALVELPRVAATRAFEPGEATNLGPRIAELREARLAIAPIAGRALGQDPAVAELETVRTTLERLEAALRARLVAAQSH